MKAIDRAQGVYRIVCEPTGNAYIGSTGVSFHERWKFHRFQLRRGTHDAKYLQNSWSKYGESAFSFKVMVVCAKENALFYEQLFMDELQPAFNTCKIAGSCLGRRFSDETKKRFSKAQRAVRPKYLLDGDMLCISEIAERTGISAGILTSRIMGGGKTAEQAVAMGPSRGTTYYEYDGRKQTLARWAQEFGENPARLLHYVKRGLSIEEAKSAIDRRHGKRLSVAEFCRLLGVNDRTFRSRILAGMNVMEAATRPAQEMDNSWRYKEAA